MMLDGVLYAKMLRSGAALLKAHLEEVNDLNVFPIPDGDTGDNMLLTLMGAVLREEEVTPSLGSVAKRVSDGMLLSARGNSGVILSQFFAGMDKGFADRSEVDVSAVTLALRQGVSQAYSAVMTPTEGTVLTVLRESVDYACGKSPKDLEELFSLVLEEGYRSLERTPELLPVLKKAGVVDSGGAGMLYILEGMLLAVRGEEVALSEAAPASGEEVSYDAFGEDSVLDFGYCTELLLRLQNAKTDIRAFRTEEITEELQKLGDSIVAVQNGSIVKIHVHTLTPHKVLELCQRFGEFLKVKIENMSLQHNSLEKEPVKVPEPPKERKRFGAVAVASGQGMKEAFLERGADAVVDGGQCMNPSAEDFIAAFDAVNAQVIFVFPNNGNVLLAAKQAAALYSSADVRVIESTTLGAGYVSLSMLDPCLDDADAIEEELREAMEGVVTAEISHCIRDAVMDGVEMKTGDYIGFVGKQLLSVQSNRLQAACETAEGIGLDTHEVCLLFCGKDSTIQEAESIKAHILSRYKGKEVYVINGGQEVYDYILVAE